MRTTAHCGFFKYLFRVRGFEREAYKRETTYDPKGSPKSEASRRMHLLLLQGYAFVVVCFLCFGEMDDFTLFVRDRGWGKESARKEANLKRNNNGRREPKALVGKPPRVYIKEWLPSSQTTVLVLFFSSPFVIPSKKQRSRIGNCGASER